MQAQVKEWGNSQGIRLPKEILKSAGISLNEFLDVTVSDGAKRGNIIKHIQIYPESHQIH